MKSFLAHYIICNSKVHTLHCCNISAYNELCIVPYCEEIAATEFHNGILLIANNAVIDRIDALCSIVAKCLDLASTVDSLIDYMGNNNLLNYCDDGNLVVLSIDAKQVKILYK